MKHILFLTSLIGLTACSGADKGPSANAPATFVEATTEPASDNDAALDFSVLPKDFPVLAEMTFSGVPQGCRLYKTANADAALAGGAPSFVFTRQQASSGEGEPLYQVVVNGKKRLLKINYSKDYGTKNIRYLTTIDAPKVDILVDIEPAEGRDDVRHKGIVGRIKGWDEDLPLLCDYNRVRVEGDCDI